MSKYKPIKVLARETIEKIAAGEAIERPASVVKELIENSIDASAKKIIIEIQSAGKKLIRVHDDGSGIPADDLPYVFLRHSTNKIEKYEDLYKLTTLGFRGEALASISAVSDTSIASSFDGNPAWQIKSHFGKITKPIPSSLSAGTTVEVKNLFFNTPARLKFLKSDATERNQIIKTVQALSLGNPAINFLFKIDGKEIFNLSATTDIEQRLKDVLGKEIFSAMLRFTASNKNQFNINGYVSGIDKFVASRQIQYLYVNNRAITSRLLTHAVYEAVKDFLPAGKHPAFVIYIEIEPSSVDVNVHPTKREVKFSNENEIYQTIQNTIKQTLQSSPPVSFYNIESGVKKDELIIKEVVFQKYETPLKVEAKLFNDNITKPSIQYLCDIFGYCILAKDENALYIIDSHAAGERILYEKYKKVSEKYDVQLLLEPLLVNLPQDRYNIVREKIELLNSIGWQIESFGESTFKCTGMPSVLADASPYDILMELLAFIETERVISEDELIKKACHSAVRAKEKLNVLESQKLINDLFSLPNYQTCPHGRPTVIKITASEITSKFKR